MIIKHRHPWFMEEHTDFCYICKFVSLSIKTSNVSWPCTRKAGQVLISDDSCSKNLLGGLSGLLSYSWVASSGGNCDKPLWMGKGNQAKTGGEGRGAKPIFHKKSKNWWKVTLEDNVWTNQHIHTHHKHEIIQPPFPGVQKMINYLKITALNCMLSCHIHV